MFFSHTIKAQPYNMPLLDKILEKKINLVDYECIRQDGNRLVAFGRFAGIAGACDFMRGIGEFLLEKNLQTFFLNVCSSFMYLDLADMIEGIKKVGKNIETKGLPEELAPYVFAVTATGRTAQGALELLEYLPHEYVTADQLADLPADNSKVYICNLTAKDLYEPIDPEKQFNKEEYYDEPEKYKSKFHTYYDKITFLIN